MWTQGLPRDTAYGDVSPASVDRGVGLLSRSLSAAPARSSARKSSQSPTGVRAPESLPFTRGPGVASASASARASTPRAPPGGIAGGPCRRACRSGHRGGRRRSSSGCGRSRWSSARARQLRRPRGTPAPMMVKDRPPAGAPPPRRGRTARRTSRTPTTRGHRRCEGQRAHAHRLRAPGRTTYRRRARPTASRAVRSSSAAYAHRSRSASTSATARSS